MILSWKAVEFSMRLPRKLDDQSFLADDLDLVRLCMKFKKLHYSNINAYLLYLPNARKFHPIVLGFILKFPRGKPRPLALPILKDTWPWMIASVFWNFWVACSPSYEVFLCTCLREEDRRMLIHFGGFVCG